LYPGRPHHLEQAVIGVSINRGGMHVVFTSRRRPVAQAAGDALNGANDHMLAVPPVPLQAGGDEFTACQDRAGPGAEVVRRKFIASNAGR